MQFLKLQNVCVLFFLGFTALTANAQISGLASYSGTGCPEGSVASTTTDDGGIISVLFDQFTGTTSATQSVVYRQCNLKIAVNVPEGFRISKVSALQNAFYSVPQGSWARMLTQIFVTNSNRVSMSAYNYIDFSQPFQDNVSLEILAQSQKKNTAVCPDHQEHIVINSNMLLMTRRKQNTFASATIDSVDTSISPKQPSAYSVLFERCSVKKGRPLPPYPRWNNEFNNYTQQQ